MNSGENEAPFDAKGRRIGILVVAYNAASVIQETLHRIPADVWAAVAVVCVIDDCSTDETVSRALDFGTHHDKVVVLRNRVAQNYGGNQKIGYQYALDHGLDAVVLLHADGRYAPERLGDLLRPIVEGDADVVLGSRMLSGRKTMAEGMPRSRFVANRVLTAIQNVLAGMSLSEFHSGYRAYRVDFLRQIPFWENTDAWHFDTQILLQAKQCGSRIREIAIPAYYGPELRPVHGVLYAVSCLNTSLVFFLFRKKVVYSRNFDIAIRGRKYFEKFNDPYSSHSLIWRWLSRQELAGKRVLELGVGDASLTRRLAEAGAVVDGVEIDALSADLARPYCRSIIVDNLDEIDRLKLTEQYDLVLAADVLEHLRDPEYILSALKRNVKVGGHLVVSLPNVANLYVRLNLLLGRFPYHTKGILDRTHLHFYTLKSAERMLAVTGWMIESKTVTAIPMGLVLPLLQKFPLSVLLKCVWWSTRLLKGLLAYQGVYFCRNPNDARLL